MKKYIYTLFAAAAAMTMVSSCDFSDFGDINKSPNSPSTEYTSMLFSHACLAVPNFIMNSSSYDPWVQEWTGYISEAKNNQFGPLGTTKNFGTGSYYYYYMKECNEIIKLNSDADTKDATNVTSFGSNGNQIGAATTLKAFYMMTLTDILGALPYSEAWQGDDDVWLPKFDSQEEIYTALFNELESAYAQFDKSGSLDSTYDLIYGGNVSKWMKLNATIRMMMAIKLADVDPATGKTRFAKAYSDGGMTANADSFNWTYDQKYRRSNFYDIGNKSNPSRGLGFGPNEVIVNALKEYKDPRLFVYTTLDGYLGKRAGEATDFDAYFGIPFGLGSNSEVEDAASVACSVADRYCEEQATFGVITTARCLLVEAEAAQLGWISASASDLYEAGIKASFDYEGATGADAYIAAHPLPADNAAALKEIVMQRFLAGFLTDGIESWSDWRRYNIPVLPINNGQVKYGYTAYPYRMQYGDNDRLYNQDNYDAAVSKYLGGKDDRWSRVWWDVADND